MTDERPDTIPLEEIDVLRFENLLLRQQLVQLQGTLLEAERARLWTFIEHRYQAQGYQADVVGKRLVKEKSE